MVEKLLDNGLFIFLCICGRYMLKYFITRLICETPTLSDKKVEAITKMISKDFKFFK